MENIAGKQDLLTSNSFPSKSLSFFKNSNSNKNSLFIPGASNFAILLLESTWCHNHFFMIDKVTWPRHAKSLLWTS